MAIKLTNGDFLVKAGLTGGKDEILLTTAYGQSIRFKESDVRSMGRSASGVTGIRLGEKDDWVVGMVIISKLDAAGNLVVVSEKGYGKKTSLNEYKTQNRGGSGILTYKTTEKTGKLIYAQGQAKDSINDALIATSSGKIIRLALDEIPQIGRNTQGVHLIKLNDDDKVTSVAFVEEEPANGNSEEKQ